MSGTTERPQGDDSLFASCRTPGTLCNGCGCATAVQVRQGQVLALAAAAEVSSEHPLAAAVLAHAQAILVPLAAAPESEAGGGSGWSALLLTSQNSSSGGGSSRGSSQTAAHIRDLSWVPPSTDSEILPGRSAARSLQLIVPCSHMS